MGRSTKPRRTHRPRLVRIPMTAGLHDQFGMTLHTALAALAIAPSSDQFDAIGQIFNVIGLTIEHDERFSAEAVILASGASAMNQIAAGYERTGTLRPTDVELLPVRNAVNVCDEILSRLDVTQLHLANVKLSAMRHRSP
jgi:hypothetical protein